MNSETLSLKSIIKSLQEKTVIIQWRIRKKNEIELKENIPDPCNAKKHQSILRKKNKISKKNQRTSKILSKAIRQAEKVS